MSPAPDATMQSRADAVAATYTGRLEGAVDLYRLTVEKNGWMVGILSTMAHGLLGLPLSWLGAPEIVSALADQHGTPGDYARMHPEAECAKIFSDGIGLGFGLGQYVLACWRCDGVEWLRQQGPTDAHADTEICKTCRANRAARPVGVRQLYQLRWRDARWLWRDPISLQWYYTGRQSMVAINPGDGEWFLFRTVPDQDIWIHGPWALGTEAAIFARDSRYDRQNTSAACAPAHVFQAKGPTDPKTRKDVEAQADGLRFGNSLTLPGEWSHEIHSASGEFVDVTAAIVTDTADLWEVCITGNRMGTQSGTGFANMDIYARATRERRAFYAGAWIRQIRAQGLVWYSLENFGTRNVPVGSYDTRSPEDKLAESKALEAEGAALKSLHEGYDALGYELEAAWVTERAQAKGVRIVPKPAMSGAVRRLDLGVDAIAAVVCGDEARAAQGLPPFGDERGKQTVALLMGDYVATPPPGTKPATAMPNAPPGGSTPAGRVSDDDCDPEDCEDGDCDAEDCARLAAQMTEHRLTECPHAKKNRCRICGVQAVRAVVPGVGGAAPTWATTWRASVVPRPRQVAA